MKRGNVVNLVVAWNDGAPVTPTVADTQAPEYGVGQLRSRDMPADIAHAVGPETLSLEAFGVEIFAPGAAAPQASGREDGGAEASGSEPRAAENGGVAAMPRAEVLQCISEMCDALAYMAREQRCNTFSTKRSPKRNAATRLSDAARRRGASHRTLQ